MPNWRMYASRDKLLRVACAASNARSCASSNWCAAVPRVLRSHCARAELVRCFPVARGMAFEGIGFSDRASSPMGDTQTAVKVSSTTVRRLLTPFTLLGRRRQRSRGLVTISSLTLLLATTPGASAEAPPSPPPMLPSAVCTTPGGYCLLSSGICSSASLVITTVSECEATAVALELSDTTATLENQRVYLPPPPPSPPPRSLSPSPPAPSPPSPPPSLPPLPPPSLPPPSPPLCWKFENQFENQFNGTRHSLEEQQIISADQQTIGTRCGAGSIGSLCGGIAMGSDFSLESAAANSMLATAQSLSMVALYPIFTAPKVRAPVAHAPASLHAQRFPRRATLARTAGTPHAKQPPRVLLGAPHPAPPRLALQRAPTPPRLPLHPHHVPRSNPRSHVTLTPATHPLLARRSARVTSQSRARA